jgi:hypothetical protein
VLNEFCFHGLSQGLPWDIFAKFETWSKHVYGDHPGSTLDSAFWGYSLNQNSVSVELRHRVLNTFLTGNASAAGVVTTLHQSARRLSSQFT